MLICAKVLSAFSTLYNFDVINIKPSNAFFRNIYIFHSIDGFILLEC